MPLSGKCLQILLEDINEKAALCLEQLEALRDVPYDLRELKERLAQIEHDLDKPPPG